MGVGGGGLEPRLEGSRQQRGQRGKRWVGPGGGWQEKRVVAGPPNTPQRRPPANAQSASTHCRRRGPAVQCTERSGEGGSVSDSGRPKGVTRFLRREAGAGVMVQQGLE